MKTTLIAAGLLGSTLLASAALAQTSPAPNASAGPGFLTRLDAGQMLVSDLMDGDVLGADNKDIGDVEDVVLDRSGRVVGLVIEVEEGIGDRTVALPLSAFQISPADAMTTGSVQTGTTAPATRDDDDVRVVVNMSVDQLKAGPEFDDND